MTDMSTNQSKRVKREHFLFPEYNFSLISLQLQKLYRFRGSGSFRRVLFQYLDDPRACSNVIFCETDNALVIYDLYPKAKLHLLVLPKTHFLQLDNIRDATPAHASQVDELITLARAIVRDFSARYSMTIRMGFHAVPSLVPLHLHMISSDLRSPFLKTKAHWNSFSTAFFVSTEVVETVLVKRKVPMNDVMSSSQQYDDLLRDSMKCLQCSTEMTNMIQLKKHQEMCC